MTPEDLINKGFFPKELPSCFFTELLGANFNSISTELTNNSSSAQLQFENQASNFTNPTPQQVHEEKIRLRQIFKNRLDYSECAQFSIPKPGLARNIIKISNPLHQGKISEVIASNYTDIESIFEKSTFSTTKPIIEQEVGQGKRAVKHDNYGHFKESCVVNSFKFSIQLKTDISKFYPSIYTHSIPWVTFGGKKKYKRNRALNQNDSQKVTSIYGDDIDNRLMWCQNQQTMGIPIGPDTSFIVAEVIACHIDELLEKRLKTKKIDHLVFRYYDDYAMYFHSELDAQIALTELKSILNEYEKYPNESVLRLALNKFNFVRVEKHNWDFFESLIFRLCLTDSGSLQKIAKLLISYKGLVNKNQLKSFCSELIHRHCEKKNDYELTWSLWLLNEFNIQPKKEIFEMVLESKCTCACIIALDLLSRNNSIKNFDYSLFSSVLSTKNLNTKSWLLVYETVFKGWVPSVQSTIILDHFYFGLLNSKSVHFYDSSRKLEPLKTNRSNLEKIDRKVQQIFDYVSKNKNLKGEIESEVNNLHSNLNLLSFKQITDRKKVQDKLTESDSQIKNLLDKVSSMQKDLKKFEKRKPFFVVERRLEELEVLTSKEIETETKQDKELLYDPKYDE
ncbi:MAG: RNA-directed DNA polymerase [Desulfobacterales bacterium]|nr:RNA-directed DNA polymerase [Desulfobacterales bacterium]